MIMHLASRKSGALGGRRCLGGREVHQWSSPRLRQGHIWGKSENCEVMSWSSSWSTWSSPQGSCLGLHGTSCPDSHPLSGSWKLSWVFDLYWLQQSCLKTKEDVNTSNRNTWHVEVNISQTKWALDPQNISDFLCPMSLSLILWIAEINYFVMCFVNPRK